MENQVWVNPDRNNLILQARFGREYGQRLARLYRRAATAFRFLQIFSGSAAFGVIIAKADSPALVAISGFVMALVSAIDMVWQPSDLSSQCARAAERWGRLDARSGRLTDAELLEQTAKLQSAVLPTWESLRNPVFNEIMRQIRSDQRVPETRFEKLVFWLC